MGTKQCSGIRQYSLLFQNFSTFFFQFGIRVVVVGFRFVHVSPRSADSRSVCTGQWSPQKTHVRDSLGNPFG